MTDIGALASKQVGPLPMGVWVIIGAGGIAVTYYMNKHKGSGSGTGSSTPTPSEATNDGSYSTVGAGAGANNSTTQNPNNNAITDNDQWRTATISYLIARGIDPGLANGAITKFLTEQTLTVQEQGVVNIALMKYGAPPTPVTTPAQPPIVTPPGTTPPKPTPTPTPSPKPKPKPQPKPKTKTVKYTVKHNDTLSGIALHFYGNASKWPKIYSANRGRVKNPNHIEPGWVLTIPSATRGF